MNINDRKLTKVYCSLSFLIPGIRLSQFFQSFLTVRTVWLGQCSQSLPSNGMDVYKAFHQMGWVYSKTLIKWDGCTQRPLSNGMCVLKASHQMGWVYFKTLIKWDGCTQRFHSNGMGVLKDND